MGGERPKRGEHRHSLDSHLGGSLPPRRTGTSAGLSMTAFALEMMSFFFSPSVDVKDALLMFLIKATASFLITKNLWLCKWTSEIHTDYGDCVNWKYQREVDCLLPICIRKIIFTLCISINLSSQELLCSSWRPGRESIDTQRLQVHSPLKGMGAWPAL